MAQADFVSELPQPKVKPAVSSIPVGTTGLAAHRMREIVPIPRNDNQFTLDQIRAAEYTRQVVSELASQGLLTWENPEHRMLLERGIVGLGRTICLPSASATAINLIYNQRVIGDREGILKVGDFFHYLLPHHAKHASQDLPKGWLVLDNTGNVYHQAISAYAEALGVKAIPVNGISTLGDFSNILDAGGQVVVSLDNRFVVDRTLARFPQYLSRDEDGCPLIRIDASGKPEFHRFERGRHAVTLLDIDDNRVVIADPFNLPQAGKNGLVVEMPTAEAEKYLRYQDGGVARGIIFLPQTEDVNIPFTLAQYTVPTTVRLELSSKLAPIRQKLREQ